MKSQARFFIDFGDFCVLTNKIKTKLQAEYNIDEADIDWIICEAVSIRRSQINMQIEITDEQEKMIYNLVNERLTGRPLAYILGKSNFYGRDFLVREGCLIPRCETEELVEVILKEVHSGNGLEIGVGSGAISITLMLENENIKMHGVDISKEALDIAVENNEKLGAGAKIYKSNLYSNVPKEKFDFIVSNPPYILSNDINFLEDEVKNYEPLIALDGGIDGLDFYRKIIEKAPQYLVRSGRIFFEIGIGEAKSIKELLEYKFKDVTVLKDLEGVERIIYATLK